MLAFVPITDRNLMQSNGRRVGRQSIINYTTITLLYPLLSSLPLVFILLQACEDEESLKFAVLKRSKTTKLC